MKWFRSLLSQLNAPMVRKAPRRWRPVLEGLEDRLVLAGNLLVSTTGTYPQQVFKEFTSTGSLVRTVNIPAPPGTSSDTARDLVQDSGGKVYVYNGTFTPALATYNPSTSTWSQQNYTGWSTVNNVSYGGIGLYQNYIFTTDMTTAGDPAGQSNGIIRFNLSNSTATRFANGTDFSDLNVGLDGKVYALAGQTLSVYDPSTLALVRTVTLPSGNDYRGVTVNAAGDIFTANWGNTVTHFSSTGALLSSVTLTGPGGGTWFGSPMDIDVASDGTLAVGTYSGHVVQMTSNFTNITYFLASSTAGVFVTFAAYQAPSPPSVSIADYSASEGNSGTTAFPFAITLSAATTQSNTVQFYVYNGTATIGSDIQTASGSVTIPAGQTTAYANVYVYGDTTYEPDETFTVKLTGVTGNATLGSHTTATGTILNDDVTSVQVFGTMVAEGNSGTTAFNFNVNLPAASNQTVTVNYATADGTATAGSDYQAASGTITFAPGQTSQNVTVLVTGDTVDEPDESFYFNLSNPVNATITGSPGRGTILNDDLSVSVSDAAPVTEGNSGTTPAVFTVSLSAPSTHTVTVGYYTAGGTATSGSDYTMTNGTLTFNPGQTSATVTVPIIGDTAYEGNETFNLYLSQPANVALGRGVGTGTIIDDDPAPTLSVSDASVAEGNSGMVACLFTVSLSAASSQTVTLTYSTAPGTATASSDYQSVTSSLSFSPGQTSKQVTVWVIGDTLLESNETFTLNLSNPSGATLARAQGTGTILDDDGPVALSIADYSAYEGNSGTTYFTFTASLSAPSGNTVSVYYTTMNGTATAGSDYQSTGGTLYFSPDQTTKTFTIPVYGDTVYEPDETFYVTLSGASGASIARAQAVGTILNDDVGLSIADYSQYEGNSGTRAFTFTASLTAASSQTVTVNYTTSNGSATAGSDYQATSGVLTFSPGQTSQAITVIVNGDTLNEANETFYVTLSGASGASLARSVATGTIFNDDPLPSLTVGDVSVTEGNSGTTPASFTVSLSAVSGQTVTVNYTTAAGTATAGSDYTSTSGTLTFAPGQTSATVTIPVIGDTFREANETFTLNLSSPVNATLARSQATGTILDDDPNGISEFTAVAAGSAADYTGNGTYTELLDGMTQMIVRHFDGTVSQGIPHDQRAIMEFDVRSLPAQQFSSITLTYYQNAWTSSTPYVLVYGYAGNGSVTLADATSPSVLLGSDTTGTGTGWRTITLDPGAVLSLTGQTGYLGLRVVGGNNANLQFLGPNGYNPLKLDFTPGTPPSPPAVSVSDVTQAEGSYTGIAGPATTNMVFTVSLSQANSTPVTVTYQTADGTAQAGSDYVATKGTLIFGPGETQKTVTVPV